MKFFGVRPVVEWYPDGRGARNKALVKQTRCRPTAHWPYFKGDQHENHNRGDIPGHP